jgi:uncharacterized protein YecT (DUF1311 family)
MLKSWALAGTAVVFLVKAGVGLIRKFLIALFTCTALFPAVAAAKRPSSRWASRCDRASNKGVRKWKCVTAFAVVVTAALAGSAAHAETGPSFNCMYAKTPDEVVICQDPELSRLDREMARLYFGTMNDFRGGFRDFIRRSQASWLNSRHRCGYDADCVNDAYAHRLAALADGDIERADWCRAGHIADVDCRR